MVIFFDIDGTLIDDTTQVIPQSTVDAIHALVAAGHIPVVNTGRPYSHVDPRVRAMPFAGWICAGGQEVLLQGKWLKKQVVPMEWMPTMIHEVRKNNLQVVYEAEDGFYLDGDYSNKHPEILRQSDLIRKIDCYVRDISEGIHHDVVKFCVFDIPDSNRAAFVKAMEPWFDAIDRRGMAEFLIKGNSKAAGMQMVLDAVGCAVEDTMAFGDSGNDLPMLDVAGTAVVMGNAAPSVKAHATVVCEACKDDGIAHELERMGLI
jgi:Cof subfamily protein (haloacid dehalogenase superfamily)